MPSNRQESIAAQPSQYKAGTPFEAHTESSCRVLKEYENGFLNLTLTD